MNLSQTIDIASQLIAHADHVILHEQSVSTSALHEYWITSKDLTNQWMQNLATCQRVLETGSLIRQRQCWLEYEPDLRDILRADVLQRVWYTILRSADFEQQTKQTESIARSVMLSQMSARLRCLKLVLLGHRFDSARMKALNELRKNAELWTDFLCGHLSNRYRIHDVLFEVNRAEQWGQKSLKELRPRTILSEGASDREGSVLQQIAHLRNQTALNPLERLTQKMLNCFPNEAFDHNGLLRPYESR